MRRFLTRCCLVILLSGLLVGPSLIFVSPIVLHSSPPRPLISVVMTYFNRENLLRLSLESIQRSIVSNIVEVIVVDDGSDQAVGALGRFHFNVEICRVEPQAKRWVNPIVASNVGLLKARGDWIVFQGAGTVQMGDILAFVAAHATEHEKYMIFKVWGVLADSSSNEAIYPWLDGSAGDSLLFEKGLGRGNLTGMWYVHPTMNKRPLHFISALHRSRMDLLGGFHPGMKNGIDFDDDELAVRISRVAQVVYVSNDGLFGVHLWHPRASYQLSDVVARRKANKAIYDLMLKQPNITWVDPWLLKDDYALFLCHNLSTSSYV